MRPAEDEHDVARLHAVADAMEIPELKPQALRKSVLAAAVDET